MTLNLTGYPQGDSVPVFALIRHVHEGEVSPPGDLAWLALRALLLCHKRVLALRHEHRESRGEERSSPGKGEQLFSN